MLLIAATDAVAFEDAPVRLVGRLVFQDGAPASNASLHVSGWGSPKTAPENWIDPSARSAEDGTFSIEFVAPRSWQFVLDTELAGFAAVSWRWTEIEPGATKVLGDITLRRAGTLRGRIVDERGTPVLTGGWSVLGEGPRGASGDGADETRVRARVAPGTAEFLLENVPPGLVRLRAKSGLTNWINGPVVEVHSGEEERADIVYQGADLSRRITVSLFSRPFFIFERDAEEILLSGPGIETRRAQRIEFSSQSHSFDDVPPGGYVIEVRDPKFLPWRMEGVESGTSIDVHLVGNAGIRLRVVDAITGASIPRYALHTSFERMGSPRTFEIQDADEEPPSDGLYEGLLPVNQTIVVRSAGHAECSIEARPLAANQVTELTARLSTGARVHGVLLGSDGRSPVAARLVHLRRSRPARGDQRFVMVESSALQVTSDTDGRFMFVGVSPGRYHVHTDDEPLLAASIADLVVADGVDEIKGLELILPGRGFLVGRLLGPEGATYAGLRIVGVNQSVKEDDAFDRDARERGSQDTDDGVMSDGSFRIGPLRAGATQLLLVPPRIESPIGFMNVTFDPPTLPLGIATILDGKEIRVEFDLRQSLPGRVQVAVTQDQRPAVGAIVELVRSPAPGDESNQRNGARRVAVGAVSSDGTAMVGPVPVGAYGFVVRSSDCTWAFWPAQHVEVSAGSVTNASVKVTLNEGRLIVKDKSGSPAKSKHISIGRFVGGIADYVVQLRSDEQGSVRLQLAPGTYSVSGFGVSDEAATIEWTERGPTVESVQLAAGKSEK